MIKLWWRERKLRKIEKRLGQLARDIYLIEGLLRNVDENIKPSYEDTKKELTTELIELRDKREELKDDRL